MKTLLQAAALLASFSFALAEDKPAGGKTDRKVVTDEDLDEDGDGKAEAHAEAETEVEAGDEGGAGLPEGVDAEALKAECLKRVGDAMKGMDGQISEECQKLIADAMAEAAKDGHAVREVKEPGKTIKVEVRISGGKSSGQPKQPETKEKN